jgi:hypothetical protein
VLSSPTSRVTGRQSARLRTGFIESNVPIRSNPGEEEFDASHRLDLVLVALALVHQIWGIPIQDVCVLRVNVNKLRCWVAWTA